MAPPWRRPTSGGPARPRPVRCGLAAPGVAVPEVRPLFLQCPPAAPLWALSLLPRPSRLVFTHLSSLLPRYKAPPNCALPAPNAHRLCPLGFSQSSLGILYGVAFSFSEKAFPGQCYFHDAHPLREITVSQSLQVTVASQKVPRLK